MEVFERGRICIFRESRFFLGRTSPFFHVASVSSDEHGVDKCFMDGGGVDVCSINEEIQKEKWSFLSTRQTDRQTDRGGGDGEGMFGEEQDKWY